MYASVLHVHVLEPSKDRDHGSKGHASIIFRIAQPLRHSLFFFPSRNFTLDKVLASNKTLKMIDFLLATTTSVDVGTYPENLY